MFKGEKVYLTCYEKEDALKLVPLINNYELQKFLSPSLMVLRSTDDELDWYESNRKNKTEKHSFAIKTVDGDKYIGGVGYFNVDYKSRHCYFGVMITDEAYQGRGYGSEAIRLLLDYIFTEMNLRKVLLSVYDFNKRAIRAYEKIGFKLEGVLKEQTYRCGRYCDDHIMAIFKDDYLKSKESP